ncbi:glycosyltransferase [Bacteroidetes/Chlorobi group bacterium Naka2016]|jgi:glycosyltransferase involved in cell wall biosynthesis|nr:MAG: glycosyltransferase [Bacteroidetes/Chlorobi group bacterium Naka2016]
MKIAYLSTFYPFRGGIAQFNARLFYALSKYAEVVAYTFKRQYPKLLFPGETQYIKPEDNPEIVESIPILDTINPISYLTTASVIKKFNPDIVVTKYWMPFFAPSLGTVLKRLKHSAFCISILDNVNPHEKFPFARQLNKFFLKQNHSFIVMSNKVQNDLIQIVPDANYSNIPHPLYDNFGSKIDKNQALEILGLPKDRKILLFFGFIREYKGLDLLLETLAILPEEYYLVIAGESYTSFDKYNEQIEKLNLRERVKLFVRYIADNEVPLFFSSADVCVLPYKSATQSGIVGIAYHFDMPVIATRVGGLHEMIEPYGSGLIVEKAVPEMLAESILKFFSLPVENFKKGVAKYKSIANWDYLASKIIEEYNYFKSKKIKSNF